MVDLRRFINNLGLSSGNVRGGKQSEIYSEVEGQVGRSASDVTIVAATAHPERYPDGGGPPTIHWTLSNIDNVDDLRESVRDLQQKSFEKLTARQRRQGADVETRRKAFEEQWSSMDVFFQDDSDRDDLERFVAEKVGARMLAQNIQYLKDTRGARTVEEGVEGRHVWFDREGRMIVDIIDAGSVRRQIGGRGGFIELDKQAANRSRNELMADSLDDFDFDEVRQRLTEEERRDVGFFEGLSTQQ